MKKRDGRHDRFFKVVCFQLLWFIDTVYNTDSVDHNIVPLQEQTENEECARQPARCGELVLSEFNFAGLILNTFDSNHFVFRVAGDRRFQRHR